MTTVTTIMLQEALNYGAESLEIQNQFINNLNN